MKKVIGVFLLSAFLATAQAQNIAVVNGKSIPKAWVDALLESVQRGGGNQALPPDAEKRAREILVRNEILSQAAEKSAVLKSDEYKIQMELAKRNILASLFISDFQKTLKISDAEIKKEYDKIRTEAGSGVEYKARHILVKDENQAKKILAALKKGKSFEELAKKESQDKGSAQNGGDLGWSTPDNYVPEFSKALQGLKKGEMTKEAVKSQFGYHIIRLEDTRENKFPELEAVKSRIEEKIRHDKTAEFIESKVKAAKVE